MNTINRGVFKPVYDEHYKLIGLIPDNFDIKDRELWLAYIQHIDSYSVGNSNYTADFRENYNLIFKVNIGKGKDKSYSASEEYFVVLQIEIYTWCRPKEIIRKEILEGLEYYPIIYMNELLDAFKQRDFYRNSEIIKIE